MARILKIFSEQGNIDNSITYITRNFGDSGLDILAVKLALGIVQQEPELQNTSPSDPALTSGPQWFDCVGNSSISFEAASRFGKVLETSLMRFQLDNQFTIINYYFSKYSVPNILRLQSEDLGLSSSDLELVRGKQLEAAGKLFDNEFGKIGEATIAVLHGWLNRTVFGNKSYYHEGNTHNDIIPLPIFETFVRLEYAQRPNANSSIISPDYALIQGQVVTPDNITSEEEDTGKFERYGWSAALQYKKIEVVNTKLDSESPLYTATEQVFSYLQSIPAIERPTSLISERERLDLLNRALEPDPNTDPEPYEIDLDHYLVFVNTPYNFERNPPSQILEDEILEYEDRALHKIIEFFELPQIWSPDPEDALFTIAYPNVLEQSLTPENNGSLSISPDRWVLTTREHAAMVTIDPESFQFYDVIDDDKFAKFKEFRSPTLRPGDVYKAAVIIDRRKLELVKHNSISQPLTTTQDRSASPSDRFDEASGQLSDQACAFLQQQQDGIEIENTARFKEYKAFAATQKREIIRKIKQRVVTEAASPGSIAGDISIDLGVFGQTNINGATLYDAYSGLDSYFGTANLQEGKTLYDENSPGPLSITFSSFPVMESQIKQLVEVFESSREAESELTFNDPSFSIDTEVSFLKKIPNVLKQIIERKKEQDNTFLPNKASENIFNPGITLEETSFTFNFSSMQNVLPSAKVTVGVSVLASEDLTLKDSPFNRQRTMNYFRNISIILGDDLGMFRGVSDCDIGRGKTTAGKISMILKYTRDLSIVDTPSLYDPIHDWTQDRVVQPFADWYSRDGRGSGTADELLTNALGLGTATQYGTALALPVLSRACDVAEIQEKFLKRFSIPSLLCDLAKCLRLPGINFKIPDLNLPSLPTWKPFTEDGFKKFLKKIEDVAIQIFKKILCALAHGILDILNTPFCNTKLEELIFIPQLNDGFEVPRKALLDALTDLGIPKTLEATDEAKSLFDDLTNILTPSEICALLSGQEVSSEVYTIISRLAEQRDLIFESFQDRESIKQFFDTIGVFVDEELCDQLGNFDEQLGTYTCEDTASLMRLLREKLQTNSASPSEIQSALEAANRDLMTRAKALEALTDINALSSLFPETITPGAEGSPIQELPGSVETAAAATLQAFMTPVKFSYLSSLRDFGNSFFMESAIVPQVGDPGYNEQATIKMERSLERLRLYTEDIATGGPLLDRELTELSLILSHVCQNFETFKVQVGNQVDEAGNPILTEAHVKRYEILEAESNTVVRSGQLTSQQELNNILTTLGIENPETNFSVEVFLNATDVDYQLKYPLQLSRVIFVSEQEGRRFNLTQIIDEETLLSAIGAADAFQQETIKIAIINKINEALQTVQQEVINNVENATRNSFSSELLKNLKPIFDSNAEALREGRSNELIQFYKNSRNEDYELLVTDTASRNRVKYSTDTDSGRYDRYSISIQDPNTTETGEEIVLNFCARIPDEIIDDEFLNSNSTKQQSFFKVFRDSFSKAHRVSEANMSPIQLRNFMDSKSEIIAGSLFQTINEGVFEQLFFNFEESDIFNEDFVERISRLVAGELYLTENESGNLCISNKFELNSDTELSFESLIIKDFVKEIMNEFSKKENDVSNIDYSQLTATEKAMANLIVKGLVRICILEIALKSSINLSVFSFREMISTYEFREYINQVCVNNILRIPAFAKKETRDKLHESVKRITGASSLKSGLISIVSNEMLPIAESIDRIFNKQRNPGSLYNFYINNLQNLNIPDRKAQGGEWILDSNLEPSQVNPFIYFENYVKLDGPLADPDTFRTPISLRRAFQNFEDAAPDVYEDLNITKPNLSYLLNYSNDLSGLGISFLEDSTEDKEIISVSDFRKLIESVTGGPDSLFVRAERDIKMLFQDGELAGRPRFMEDIPSAAYEIERQKFVFNGSAISSKRFFSDSSLSELDIRNSMVRTLRPTIDKDYFVERAPGEVMLKPDLSNMPLPSWTDDYADFGINNPYVEAIKESEQISFITRGTPPKREIRGITRTLNLDSQSSRSRFEIKEGYQEVYKEPRYDKVSPSVYNSYPEEFKVKVQEIVIDLVDEATPVYDTLGEIDTRHTDADWESLQLPAGYQEDMVILKELMKSDDPNFTGTEAGPFKFRGSTGCFVHGLFGFTYLEDPGGRSLLPPVHGMVMDNWSAVRKNTFSYSVGNYPNATNDAGNQLTDFLIIEGVSTNFDNYPSFNDSYKERRYIRDNQYEIPTRILMTRYDTIGNGAHECYANFKLPSFLESTNARAQAQQIMDAWHRLVKDYIQNIRRAYRYLKNSTNLIDASELESYGPLSTDPTMITAASVRAAYEAVKSVCPEFPVFYSRYLYAQGFDETNPPNIVVLNYRGRAHTRKVRRSFFNREKLLREICFQEVSNNQGAFSFNKQDITEMFKDRGLLLKSQIPSKTDRPENMEHDQMSFDKCSFAGDPYNIDFLTVLRNFYNQGYIPGSAFKVKSTIDSLINWFGQRRHDSLWGRTYTSRIEKSPNLKIEKPGILCGVSPFYADGRCSLTELKLAFQAVNNRIREQFGTRTVTELGIATRLEASEEFLPTATKVRELYDSILTEAKESVNGFIQRLGLNFIDFTLSNPDVSSARDKYIYTCIFERDTINYLDSYGSSISSNSLDQRPYFHVPALTGWWPTADSLVRYSSAVVGGVSSDGGSAAQETFSIARNYSGLLNWKNNTLALIRGVHDGNIGGDSVTIDTELSQYSRGQLAGYGIHYESNRMVESPLHHLSSIGINFSGYEEIRKLLQRPRSFGIDQLRHGVLYSIRDPKSALMLSFLTSRSMNAANNRNLRIFNRLRQTYNLSLTIEADYERALTSVGILELVRILYSGLTDQAGTVEDFVYDQYFMNTEISHGIRMMMCIPDRSESKLGVEESLANYPALRTISEEQRMGNVVDSSGRKYETFFMTNFEEVINLEDPCWNTTSLERLEDRYRELSTYRFQRIQEEQEFLTYFKYLIPIDRLASTAAIYNTTLLGSYNTFPLLLDSTKNMMGTMFYEAVKKTINGTAFSDNTLADLGISTLDGPSVFDITAKNARPGGSKRGDCDLFPVDFEQWIKMLGDMLEEFVKFVPSMILRGIANQIDPAYKEMKHHWNSCNLDGFSFVGKRKDGRGDPIKYYTAKRSLQLGVDKRKPGQRAQEGQYAPVNFAFPADLVAGVFTFDVTQMQRSINKFITYIYAGQLPFLDPSYAFQIPCFDIDNAGDSAFNWDKFKFGQVGRYGHPVTPFTYLALLTPVMRRDVKDQRFRCQILGDGSLANNTRRSDLPEC